MKKIAFILLALLMMVVPVMGRDYYIAKYGNDANDGLTWETAKSNLQSIVPNIRTNATTYVYVGAGEWQMTNVYMLMQSNTYLKGTNRDTTILKAAPTNPVAYCNYTNISFDSFTITEGENTSIFFGGGIASRYADYRMPFLKNCLITSNRTSLSATDGRGGGIGPSLLLDCEISYNVANRYGGGAYSIYATNCYIHHNMTTNASGVGGATHGGLLDGCVVNCNTSNSGGGIYIASIYNSTIVSNTALVYDGGGAYNSSGTNCYLAYNTAARWGGGITVEAPGISNFTLYRNFSSDSGGGLVSADSTRPAYRCLMIENYSAVQGGGAWGAYIYNSVFVSNSAPNYPCAYQSFEMFNCDVLGHTNTTGFLLGGRYASSPIWNNVIYGNGKDTIDTSTNLGSNYIGDPLFLSGSYKLTAGSPCIDFGSDTYAVDKDFYGRDRRYGLHVDIGAAEFYPEDVPVTIGAKRKAIEAFWGL